MKDNMQKIFNTLPLVEQANYIKANPNTKFKTLASTIGMVVAWDAVSMVIKSMQMGSSVKEITVYKETIDIELGLATFDTERMVKLNKYLKAKNILNQFIYDKDKSFSVVLDFNSDFEDKEKLVSELKSLSKNVKAG